MQSYTTSIEYQQDVTIQAVDIQEPNPIDISIEYLNYVSCDGDGDGSLTNSIQGGTPPYEFEWVDFEFVSGNQCKDQTCLICGRL